MWLHTAILSMVNILEGFQFPNDQESVHALALAQAAW
jgi:hypothetical protein